VEVSGEIAFWEGVFTECLLVRVLAKEWTARHLIYENNILVHLLLHLFIIIYEKEKLLNTPSAK
jgi:hypothetical protein